MEIYGYVYMVRNKINGKIYFGITIYNFYIRYKGNIAKYTHNEHLQNSIKEYGIENFEIIEQFDVAYNEDDLWDLEDMYICLYNTLDSRYGYNKKRSGSKRKGCGKHSVETKNKIGEAEKGEKHWNYGKHHTEETKRRNSESQKRLYENGYVNPNKGKSMSKEQKEKISETRKEKGIGRGENNPRARAVICLNTLQVFLTIKDAMEWCNGNKKIIACCKDKTKSKSSGKHPITGERLHWMYYSDYLEQQNKENSDTSNN